jgi:hypothetical protein
MEFKIVREQWNHPEVGEIWEQAWGLPANWVQWDKYSSPHPEKTGIWRGKGTISFPEKTFRVIVIGSQSMPGGYFGCWSTIPQNPEEYEEFMRLFWKYSQVVR